MAGDGRGRGLARQLQAGLCTIERDGRAGLRHQITTLGVQRDLAAVEHTADQARGAGFGPGAGCGGQVGAGLGAQQRRARRRQPGVGTQPQGLVGQEAGRVGAGFPQRGGAALAGGAQHQGATRCLQTGGLARQAAFGTHRQVAAGLQREAGARRQQDGRATLHHQAATRLAQRGLQRQGRRQTEVHWRTLGQLPIEHRAARHGRRHGPAGHLCRAALQQPVVQHRRHLAAAGQAHIAVGADLDVAEALRPGQHRPRQTEGAGRRAGAPGEAGCAQAQRAAAAEVEALQLHAFELQRAGDQRRPADGQVEAARVAGGELAAGSQGGAARHVQPRAWCHQQ